MAGAAPHAVSIESADDAQQVHSEDEKTQAAEAEAAAAAAAAENAPNERFVEYVVPRRATAQYVDEKGKVRKIETRPTKPHTHASVAGDGSYSSRVGVANARARITPQDWASNGVAVGETQTLLWDFSNNWRIPAAQLTVEQINFLLKEEPRMNKSQPRFELVDGNGNKVDN